ncbi:prolipoprotein diacylglyceryl transferase [Exiguobacterium sp. s50]|uniref:prolipoprotein diacylglyceryl transferase n=1 Tax=Exiguobacterium sp. s50 TaxID=2751234 RepID=UPI001BEB92DB|nr:prolipoprotein diacylglyceryl transferase [Exiguobacterium sp. s50]
MVEPTFDRVAFEIGSLPIYWYGMIIAFGAMLGLVLALFEAKRLNYDSERVVDVIIWSIPISIVFARIYYVIFQWDYYSQNLGQIIDIRQGGIAIHGAIFGALLVVVIYCMRKSMSFWKITDILAPSLLLGQAVGRWGNFMNQEAHGAETTSRFLNETLFLPDWIVNQMYIDGAYYLPTFLFESVWNIIGVILLVVWRMVGNPPRGYIFLSYLVWYSIGRFYIEGLRTDSLMAGDLRTAQLVSIAMIVFGIVMMIVRRKAKRYDDPSEKGLFD